MVGIRPEHFEDAGLIDADQKAAGATFTAQVEVLESMGSDKYVYFSAEGPQVSSRELEELAADSGTEVAGGDIWWLGCRPSRLRRRAARWSCGSIPRKSRCSIRIPGPISLADRGDKANS